MPHVRSKEQAAGCPDVVALFCVRQAARGGLSQRRGLFAGGNRIRTSGTAEDARLVADLYAHDASRRIPKKGSSDQIVACLRCLAAGVVGSATACAFRFRPPGTGSKRAGWRRSGAILFAFFGAVCFEPDASSSAGRDRASPNDGAVFWQRWLSGARIPVRKGLEQHDENCGTAMVQGREGQPAHGNIIQAAIGLRGTATARPNALRTSY